jgi:peptidoglycan/LPS O-acetylase OafA/YrhL
MQYALFNWPSMRPGRAATNVANNPAAPDGKRRAMMPMIDFLKSIFSQPSRRSDGHIVTLDALRGIAAVSVMFWHYQHFYYGFGVPHDQLRNPSLYPLHQIFALAYDNGYLAVQLFWMLSGFVFLMVYPPDRTTKTVEFVANRFARLYPLHFLTLLVVAALQYIALARLGRFAIFDANDTYDFFLNLFMISGWGFAHGDSFNAPIWSISVELISYALFWIFRKQAFRLGVAIPIIVAVLAAVVSTRMGAHRFIFQSIACFFFGAGIYIVFSAIPAAGLRLAVSALGLVASVAIAAALPQVSMQCRIFAIFPCLILLAASINCRIGDGLLKGLSNWLGNISYGVYLWQIPVQIVLVLLITTNSLTQADVATPWLLLAYIGSTIVVATISYHLFEDPMRKTIRALQTTTKRAVASGWLVEPPSKH